MMGSSPFKFAGKLGFLLPASGRFGDHLSCIEKHKHQRLLYNNDAIVSLETITTDGGLVECYANETTGDMHTMDMLGEGCSCTEDQSVLRRKRLLWNVLRELCANHVKFVSPDVLIPIGGGAFQARVQRLLRLAGTVTKAAKLLLHEAPLRLTFIPPRCVALESARSCAILWRKEMEQGQEVGVGVEKK